MMDKMQRNLSRMKKATQTVNSTAVLRIVVAFVLVVSSGASGDVVYVTARGLHGPGPNDDGTYADNGFGNDSTAMSTAPGAPARNGSRYFSNSFSNSTPDLAITLSPTLGLTGAIYQVDHTFSSIADNISSNIFLRVTNVAGCTLSFTNNVDRFQAQYGQPAPQSWQFLGYLTNQPGSATPVFTLYFQSGHVSAADDQRLNVDCFRFTSLDPCLTVPSPTITGPLFSNAANVTVAGVVPTATNVAIYQNSGAGMVKIGSLNVSNPPATLLIPVSGLVKGAQAAATQKVKGQESCVPTTGALVGGGANPSVRVALSIRGNPDLAGPVGSTGGGTNANVYFLGASNLLSGACPDLGVVLQPGTNWQTVTFTRGGDSANPIDPVVLWNDGGGAFPTLDGNFGALDGLAFACQSDNGPFDIYLDDLANGTNGVFQNWEAGTPGAAYGFVAPRFSGTTAGNLMTAPDESVVATNTAFTGTRSLRVKWQFAGGATNLWLRLVTAGALPVQNPQVDLNEPVSFKILLLRPGDPVPPPPVSSAPGLISISRNGTTITLNWTGTWQLQAAPAVTGVFTNIPGVTTGPYAPVIEPGARFYRLRN
jgi:hypothetical protein